LRGVCNAANWPDMGRSLIFNNDVDTSLQKDQSYKLAMNIGGTELIREGRFPKLSGFEIAPLPSLPANGENLIGFAAYQSALLIAFAPVEPAQAVKDSLSAFEQVIDPDTGISLTFRKWGNADMDQSREIIECSYGFAAGEAAALKRIVSA